MNSTRRHIFSQEAARLRRMVVLREAAVLRAREAVEERGRSPLGEPTGRNHPANREAPEDRLLRCLARLSQARTRLSLWLDREAEFNG